MSEEYKIIEGDCLSIISRNLGISVERLLAMNSDQIKNADLIYAGNVLNISDDANDIALPAEPSKVTGERIPLPDVPSNPKNVCKPKVYEDVIYYPSMPHSGEQGWFALTSEAAEKVKEEITHMRNLMDSMAGGGIDTAMAELSKYGILSKFQSTDHERFLTEQKDKDRYRALLYLQLALKSEERPFLTALLSIREHEKRANIISVIDELKKRYENELNNELFLTRIKSVKIASLVAAGFSEDTIADVVNKEGVAQRKLKWAIKNTVKTVINQLAEEIDELEKKAREYAATLKSDDDTPFVYSEEMGYFTSTQEKGIAKALEGIDKARGMYSLKLEDICTKKETVQKCN